MPETLLDTLQTLEAEADGVLVAPVERGGVWAALRSLRAGMRKVGGGRAEFLTPISHDGRILDLGQGRPAVLVLGYRLDI